MKVVAAVLAAGASQRFGRPKQLALLYGTPLVRYAILATATCHIAERTVVLGAHADEVARALDGSIVPLRNPLWSEGIASSIRAAVAWAHGRRAAALVLLLGDQPLVGARHVGRLVDAWREGAPAVASVYADVLGVPALFDASLFAELRTLTGDRGAAGILRSRVDVARVPCPEASLDVDTSLDLDAHLDTGPPKSAGTVVAFDRRRDPRRKGQGT
jgi:CTP:molybdopterin cytidylyltransferase MocA